MSQVTASETPIVKRVDELVGLDAKRYDHWKYYEGRADHLGDRLWSVGIWLMAILAATLSLPFVAGFIKPANTYFPIQIAHRIPVAVLALFGMLFCIYAYAALRDLREHIESNWRKANYVLNGTWEVNWGGRKSHGWSVLLGVGVMAFAAFAVMFVLSIVGA